MPTLGLVLLTVDMAVKYIKMAMTLALYLHM